MMRGNLQFLQFLSFGSGSRHCLTFRCLIPVADAMTIAFVGSGVKTAHLQTAEQVSNAWDLPEHGPSLRCWQHGRVSRLRDYKIQVKREVVRMSNWLRLTGFLCAVFMLVGCENSRKSIDTRTYHGAFNMIVMEVENLQQQVNAETYTGQFSPIEDQLGSAIYAFMSNEDVKGTPLEAEAKKLADQEAKILEIWQSSDSSVEKIRAAAKEMLDQIEHMKTMI